MPRREHYDARTTKDMSEQLAELARLWRMGYRLQECAPDSEGAWEDVDDTDFGRGPSAYRIVVDIKCAYFKESGKYYADGKVSMPYDRALIYPRDWGLMLLEKRQLPGLQSGTWDGPFTVETIYTELVMPKAVDPRSEALDKTRDECALAWTKVIGHCYGLGMPTPNGTTGIDAVLKFISELAARATEVDGGETQRQDSWEAVFDLCESLGMDVGDSLRTSGTGRECVLAFIKGLANLRDWERFNATINEMGAYRAGRESTVDAAIRFVKNLQYRYEAANGLLKSSDGDEPAMEYHMLTALTPKELCQDIKAFALDGWKVGHVPSPTVALMEKRR